MISNWKQLWRAQFVKDPETGHTIWRRERELREQMTPKFRRLYLRVVRRVERQTPMQWAETAFSRRYVEVTARKHRARKRRRRR